MASGFRSSQSGATNKCGFLLSGLKTKSGSVWNDVWNILHQLQNHHRHHNNGGAQFRERNSEPGIRNHWARNAHQHHGQQPGIQAFYQSVL